LWLDEVFLALNILDRRFAELLQPLDDVQAAPIGFLFAERLAVNLFGSSEYALRLVPLLCGIASVFLFWRLARQLLPPVGVVVSLAIFAVSRQLIYFSAEVKQYSLDVTAALFLWWAFARLERQLEQGWRGPALAALLGGIVVWFSYPAVFVLGGVGIHWFWQGMHVPSRTALLVRGLVGAVAVGSFTVAYLTAHVVNEQTMQELWRRSAAPLLPRSLEDLAWFKAGIMTLAALPLGWTALGLVALTAFIGTVALWQHDRTWFCWFGGALMLTYLASALGKYPLAARLWVFLSPVIILLVAKGIEEVWRRTRPTLPVLAPALTVLLLAQPLVSAGHQLLHPREREEVRPLLEHVRQHHKQGDLLYLYHAAEFATRYYAGRGLAFPGEVIVSVRGRGNWSMYEQDLERLRGRARVWVLFSHVERQKGFDEENLILQWLDRTGVRLDTQRRTGASVYLYDLARRPTTSSRK
jgi:hypothetical protein